MAISQVSSAFDLFTVTLATRSQYDRTLTTKMVRSIDGRIGRNRYISLESPKERNKGARPRAYDMHESRARLGGGLGITVPDCQYLLTKEPKSCSTGVRNPRLARGKMH